MLTTNFPRVAILTCYFNPQRSVRRLKNYEYFRSQLGSDIHVIEGVVGDQPFQLSRRDCSLQVRYSDSLWQKERLLNLLTRALPEEYDAFIWLDCDLVFENPDWVTDARRALLDFPVVQLFQSAVRLREDGSEGQAWKSCADTYLRMPTALTTGYFTAHGHTGFAWGAWRSIIKTFGLYDRLMSGCGDHAMAHGWLGDSTSPCVRRVLGGSETLLYDFNSWATSVSKIVDGRIGCVPGRIRHLWHGDEAARQYDRRCKELAELEFDPARDLVLDKHGQGCWAWAENANALRSWALSYFEWREEGRSSGNESHENGQLDTENS